MRHVSNTVKCCQLMLLAKLLTLSFLDILGIKLYFILNFIIFFIVMSSDIVEKDRALGGDLGVVQETKQLQGTFTKMVGSLVNDNEDV